MATELNETYQTGSGPVHLRVTIGDGQGGKSEARVGTTRIGRARTIDEDIGSGPDVAGKTLVVISVVNHDNHSTNRTSVTYKLTGGASPFARTLTHTVSSVGEVVTYTAEIELT